MKTENPKPWEKIMLLCMVYYAVKAVVDYGIEIQMVLKIFIRFHIII
jgi:hypothetical protein